MKKTINYLAATAFMLASTAASAVTVDPTVWAPTSNQDVDLLQFNFDGLTTNGGALFMFDEADFGGNALKIGADGGHVTFTASGSDWIAQVFDVNNASDGTTITLSGDNHFVLGMKWVDSTFPGSVNGYFPDSGWALESTPDTYLITFDGFKGAEDPITGSTVAVDVQVVPVPAAVWLFGSGLIGLVGVARRKRA